MRVFERIESWECVDLWDPIAFQNSYFYKRISDREHFVAAWELRYTHTHTHILRVTITCANISLRTT